MGIRRMRIIREGTIGIGPIIYWMSRDQRVKDNWALKYAQGIALERKVPLIVVFTLSEEFLGATSAHYAFLTLGLKEISTKLTLLNIPFDILKGNPVTQLLKYLFVVKPGLIVSDFDPLRVKKTWKTEIASKISIPMHEVDAHNIVPCWLASPKQEFGAFTIRPKILRLLPSYLENPQELEYHPYRLSEETTQKLCNNEPEKTWGHSPSNPHNAGEDFAWKRMNDFFSTHLSSYADMRNNPLKQGTSGLSTYLHFGQISAARIATSAWNTPCDSRNRDSFLEELIIRRELADNYCNYNQEYDNTKGFPAWAQETLLKHQDDKRQYIYSLALFEEGKTHDAAWNAAQRQLLTTGTMHGYVRMYWAKKILEWTPDAETAMHIAIFLNDRYEMDGRDPSGYTGIAWCIGGVHDRPWPERPIYGKIRSMVYSGLRKKFDVAAWEKLYPTPTSASESQGLW